VYGWLWRHFPGGLLGKIVGSLAMTAVAIALLFLVVFPRVEPLLPFQDVTVDTGPTAKPTATATATPTP
jgi:hypothetical protein